MRNSTIEGLGDQPPHPPRTLEQIPLQELYRPVPEDAAEVPIDIDDEDMQINHSRVRSHRLLRAGGHQPCFLLALKAIVQAGFHPRMLEAADMLATGLDGGSAAFSTRPASTMSCKGLLTCCTLADQDKTCLRSFRKQTLTKLMHRRL